MPAYDPSRDNLLLFDGVCHLCDSGVRFIIRRDQEGKIKYAPIQSELGRELYQRHGLDPELPTTLLLLTPRGAFKASDASLEIARILGGWWKLAVVFQPLPRGLRDLMYYFIARNRYRWFGKEDACMMPTPELKARVVTG